jgi:hypothetical protein
VSLLMIVLALASSRRGRAQERSGTYGPDVYVLIGSNEALLSYSWEGRHRSCGCELRAIHQSDGSYSFDNSPDAPGRFIIDTKGLRFDFPGEWSCCGSGVPPPHGVLAFTAPPARCSVRAERAPFYENPVKLMNRHPYVQRGDVVQTIPTPATADGEGGFVIAMFQGPKKATIGLLKRSDLDCPR